MWPKKLYNSDVESKVKIKQSTVYVAAGRRIQVIRRLMIGDEGKWANAANAFFVSAKQQIMCIVSIVMFKLVHPTPLNKKFSIKRCSVLLLLFSSKQLQLTGLGELPRLCYLWKVSCCPSRLPQLKGVKGLVAIRYGLSSSVAGWWIRGQSVGTFVFCCGRRFEVLRTRPIPLAGNVFEVWLLMLMMLLLLSRQLHRRLSSYNPAVKSLKVQVLPSRIPQVLGLEEDGPIS